MTNKELSIMKRMMEIVHAKIDLFDSEDQNTIKEFCVYVAEAEEKYKMFREKHKAATAKYRKKPEVRKQETEYMREYMRQRRAKGDIHE